MPGEDDRHAVAAGVDHAGLAQRGQQLGAAAHGRLAGGDRALEDVGDRRVLLLGGRARAQARVGHVRQLAHRERGHLAHHREHRALGRLAHRGVAAVGGARHRGADEHRIDELAGPRDQLLGGAADQLRQDHPAVAAGAQQRRALDALDDLVAPDVVDRALAGLLGQLVDLGQARAQRERHVVARVAVGDGEHVEVVDLLAARLEVRQSALHDGAEANETRLGRRRGHEAAARRPW